MMVSEIDLTLVFCATIAAKSEGHAMITQEIEETAEELKSLILEAADMQVVDESFHAEVRAICADLLGSAGVDSNGGCPFCQS